MRVAVQEGADRVKVGSSTKAAIRDGSGRNLGELTANSAQSAQFRSGKVAIGSWAAKSNLGSSRSGTVMFGLAIDGIEAAR